MKLFYFSRENLGSSFFIKEFVAQLPEHPQRGIVLHDYFDSVTDTRFVTKRISAVMSELMVVNNAFSGEQRQLFRQGADGLEVRAGLITDLLQTVDLLVLNTLVAGEDGVQAGNPEAILSALRKVLPLEEVVLFADNTRSPLVREKQPITADTDLSEWLALYEEERSALERAQRLAPVSLSSAANYHA